MSVGVGVGVGVSVSVSVSVGVMGKVDVPRVALKDGCRHDPRRELWV